jgi:hypothetical protein
MLLQVEVSVGDFCQNGQGRGARQLKAAPKIQQRQLATSG